MTLKIEADTNSTRSDNLNTWKHFVWQTPFVIAAEKDMLTRSIVVLMRHAQNYFWSLYGDSANSITLQNIL